MNRHGAVELDFGDGTYTFRLGLKDMDELEAKTGLGIFEIMDALDPKARSARSSLIAETIRIGLIGGGMPPVEALSKVRRYCDERPLTESLFIAYAVAVATITRVAGEDKGSPSGEFDPVKSDAPISPESMPLAS